MLPRFAIPSSVLEFGGDSMAAIMQALAILVAKAYAAQAVEDADAALDDLGEVQNAWAMAVADRWTWARRTLLDSDYDNAITLVEAHFRDVTSVRDSTALVNAVMKVALRQSGWERCNRSPTVNSGPNGYSRIRWRPPS